MGQVVQKEVAYEKGVPIANAVIYEAAYVSAKLRNTLLLGGERPKDLHFLQDQVDTPTVRMVEAPRREGQVGGRPGENISDLTPICLRQAVESAAKLAVSPTGSLEVLVERGLLGEACGPEGEGVLLPVVAARAEAFSKLLYVCWDEVLKGVPAPMMIYMPTICADVGVSINSDSRVVVNLKAFEQADCCSTEPHWFALLDSHWQPFPDEVSAKLEETFQRGDSACERQIGRFTYTLDLAGMVQKNAETGRERPIRREGAFPVGLRPEDFRRQLVYWTQRVAMVGGATGPTGLYDAAVRQRFAAALGRAASDGRASGCSTPRRAWPSRG